MKRYAHLITLLAFAAGLVMMGVSFVLPPEGVIDPSVLNAVGMVFTFAAVVEGLWTGKVVRIRRGDSEVFLGDPERGERS